MSVWGTVANLLGIGRVPLSIVLMVLLLSWGMIGFITNRLLIDRVREAWMVAMYSLPLALIGSVLATRGVAGLIGRYLPLNQSSARRRHELLGSVGEAIYDIDQKFGMVSGHDAHGDLFQVGCRVHGDQKPIAKGAKVHLVAYNAKDGVFYVIPEEGL